MRFSLSWISDFVDASGDPAEIAGALNDAGIEIGRIDRFDADGAVDTVFDADLTPNRPDAMNHRGIARDLAAVLARPFDEQRFRGTFAGASSTSAPPVAVAIEAPDRCRRFALRTIHGASSRPSPDRWKRRLAAIGAKSVDMLVDATNISLWGFGQPLHAFDADAIAGPRLIVRFARRGERLLCLDGVERTLHPEDVVVADETRALSLAGVIGGAESAIRPGRTRNVVIEAAWWDPPGIRATARRHGLHTDASHRYERGADIGAIPEGLDLATGLILDHAGGELAGPAVDVYPRPADPRRVRLRLERLRALSGLPDFELERAAEILARLGFRVDQVGDGLEAEVPLWRPDVGLEVDLIEEVLRIHGYSRIPSSLPPAERLAPYEFTASAAGDALAPRAIEEEARDQAREAGLFEAMNFPFLPDGDDGLGNLLGKDRFRSNPLRLTNPLDASRPALRRLILPGLIESASRNHRNDLRTIALFEVGRVWDREVPPGADPAELESRHLALLLAGSAPESAPPRAADVLDAKGIVDRIVRAVADAEPEFRPFESDRFSEWSAAEIRLDGTKVGVLGRLAGPARGDWLLPDSVEVAEIELGRFPPRRREVAFRDFPRHPPADVELTVVCREDARWGEIEGTIRGADLRDLEEFRFLGAYSDPSAEGTRKISVGLRFRASGRTLSQEEVNAERDRLFGELERRFGV